MQDEVSKLSQRLDAANMCIEALQGELALLQQVGSARAASLRTFFQQTMVPFQNLMADMIIMASSFSSSFLAGTWPGQGWPSFKSCF